MIFKVLIVTEAKNVEVNLCSWKTYKKLCILCLLGLYIPVYSLLHRLLSTQFWDTVILCFLDMFLGHSSTAAVPCLSAWQIPKV